MRSITVVIADREGRRSATCLGLLGRARGIRVLGSAATVQEAVACAAQRPDIMLLDLKMTQGSDHAAVALVRSNSPGTQIILLAGRAKDAEILDAIAQGARGYLDAALLRRFLVKAVKVVAAGESWVSRAMVSKLIDRLARMSQS